MIPLAIDHLGHIPLEDCIKLARRLEKFNLGWMEDPVPWQMTEQYVRLANATTTPIGRTSGPSARLAGRCSQAPSADSADGPPGSAAPARTGEGASSRPASKGRKDERRGDDRRCMEGSFSHAG